MAKKKKKTNNNNKGGSPSAGKQPAVGDNSNDINDEENEKIQITIQNSECTNSDWSSLRKCLYNVKRTAPFSKVASNYTQKYKKVTGNDINNDDFEFQYGDLIIGLNDTPNSIGITGNRAVIDVRQKISDDFSSSSSESSDDSGPPPLTQRGGSTPFVGKKKRKNSRENDSDTTSSDDDDGPPPLANRGGGNNNKKSDEKGTRNNANKGDDDEEEDSSDGGASIPPLAERE